MDLEQLTKTQLILLALLLSFVTSLATGIVTVTLMNQAPADVIRTVNRVVEKTVERVVPGETRIIETIKEVNNPTEGDLAVSAVEKSKNILIYIKTADGLETRGFLISNKGEAVIAYVEGLVEGQDVGVNWNGNTSTTSPNLPAVVVSIAKASSLALIKLKDMPVGGVPYVNLLQATVPTLGQNVISISYGSKSGINLEFGKVTSIVDSDAKEGTRRFVMTPGDSFAHIGSPIVDYSARVLGMNFGPKEGYDGSVIVPLPVIDAIFGKVLGMSTATSTTP